LGEVESGYKEKRGRERDFEISRFRERCYRDLERGEERFREREREEEIRD
jgi:hypothetical protein